LFYHESWQNDICSFRAMTVALTVSFKLTFVYNGAKGMELAPNDI